MAVPLAWPTSFCPDGRVAGCAAVFVAGNMCQSITSGEPFVVLCLIALTRHAVLNFPWWEFLFLPDCRKSRFAIKAVPTDMTESESKFQLGIKFILILCCGHIMAGKILGPE